MPQASPFEQVRDRLISFHLEDAREKATHLRAILSRHGNQRRAEDECFRRFLRIVTKPFSLSQWDRFIRKIDPWNISFWDYAEEGLQPWEQGEMREFTPAEVKEINQERRAFTQVMRRRKGRDYQDLEEDMTYEILCPPKFRPKPRERPGPCPAEIPSSCSVHAVLIPMGGDPRWRRKRHRP